MTPDARHRHWAPSANSVCQHPLDNDTIVMTPPGRRHQPPVKVNPSPPLLPLPCEFDQNLVKFERNLLCYVTVYRIVNEICKCLEDLGEFD
jgi:hypothetical protein